MNADRSRGKRVSAAAVFPIVRYTAARNSYAGPHDGFVAEMIEKVLNLRGLRCPQPVLRASKAMKTLPLGGSLVLECTDPLTLIDVPHFVTQTGQEMTMQEQRGDLYVYRIVKRR